MARVKKMETVKSVQTEDSPTQIVSSAVTQADLDKIFEEMNNNLTYQMSEVSKVIETVDKKFTSNIQDVHTRINDTKNLMEQSLKKVKYKLYNIIAVFELINLVVFVYLFMTK